MYKAFAHTHTFDMFIYAHIYIYCMPGFTWTATCPGPPVRIARSSDFRRS